MTLHPSSLDGTAGSYRHMSCREVGESCRRVRAPSLDVQAAADVHGRQLAHQVLEHIGQRHTLHILACQGRRASSEQEGQPNAVCGTTAAAREGPCMLCVCSHGRRQGRRAAEASGTARAGSLLTALA